MSNSKDKRLTLDELAGVCHALRRAPEQFARFALVNAGVQVLGDTWSPDDLCSLSPEAALWVEAESLRRFPDPEERQAA